MKVIFLRQTETERETERDREAERQRERERKINVHNNNYLNGLICRRVGSVRLGTKVKW